MTLMVVKYLKPTMTTLIVLYCFFKVILWTVYTFYANRMGNFISFRAGVIACIRSDHIDDRGMQVPPPPDLEINAKDNLEQIYHY